MNRRALAGSFGPKRPYTSFLNLQIKMVQATNSLYRFTTCFISTITSSPPFMSIVYKKRPSSRKCHPHKKDHDICHKIIAPWATGTRVAGHITCGASRIYRTKCERSDAQGISHSRSEYIAGRRPISLPRMRPRPIRVVWQTFGAGADMESAPTIAAIHALSLQQISWFLLYWGKEVFLCVNGCRFCLSFC